jgi:PPM family protein phosphatase
MTLTYGLVTTHGRTSKVNQDGIFISENVFMVVDGMGAAEVTRLVIETISNHLLAQSITSPATAMTAFTEAYSKATEAIQQQGYDGGASATTVVINGDMAYIAHLGSTRAYAVNRQSLELLTTDHTMEEKSLDFGMNFTGDPYAPVVYQVVGQPDAVPDTLFHPVKKGTGILLISDGVYRAGAHMLEDLEGIEEVILPMNNEAIKKIIHEANNAQVACDNLIDAAYDAEGNDDLSALFLSNEFPFKAD